MTRDEWDALGDVGQEKLLQPLIQAIHLALELRRRRSLPTNDTVFLIYTKELAAQAMGRLPDSCDFVIIPVDSASAEFSMAPAEGDVVREKARVVLSFDPNVGPRAVLILADSERADTCYAVPMQFPILARGGSA